MKRILIIGAGFGSLVAAAELTRRGENVTVLEAHIYPGGCAGSFYYQKYRFDAGATLAGGFAPGMPMDLVGNLFAIDWQAVFSPSAMTVHLPGSRPIIIWTDQNRWKEERQASFGVTVEPFWSWQNNTAETMWEFALKLPPWPPQNFHDIPNLANLIFSGSRIHPGIFPDAFRPIAHHMKNVNEQFRLFIDGQLLISSQATSQSANALYAASALDLAHRGVVHVPGGVGGMAKKLSDRIQQFGGKVLYRHQVNRVTTGPENSYRIKTKTGEEFTADIVIFNLTPWNVSQILAPETPFWMRIRTRRKPAGWGAFTLYLGIDNKHLPEHLDLHHQIISDRPLGEGNSIFLSISPEWDANRTPPGKRAITISTHTNLEPWWALFKNDSTAYEARKSEYTQRILTLAGRVIPGLSQSAELILPGTPITFQRFTHRVHGWVGGFPQTNLFRSWGPRIGKNLWMVGDSIFPGQSVAAVSLGGLRVAKEVLKCM